VIGRVGAVATIPGSCTSSQGRRGNVLAALRSRQPAAVKSVLFSSCCCARLDFTKFDTPWLMIQAGRRDHTALCRSTPTCAVCLLRGGPTAQGVMAVGPCIARPFVRRGPARTDVRRPLALPCSRRFHSPAMASTQLNAQPDRRVGRPTNHSALPRALAPWMMIVLGRSIERARRQGRGTMTTPWPRRGPACNRQRVRIRCRCRVGYSLAPPARIQPARRVRIRDINRRNSTDGRTARS